MPLECELICVKKKLNFCLYIHAYVEDTGALSISDKLIKLVQNSIRNSVFDLLLRSFFVPWEPFEVIFRNYLGSRLGGLGTLWEGLGRFGASLGGPMELQRGPLELL